MISLKYLAPCARILRDSLMSRFIAIFTRVGMGMYAGDVNEAPFGNKVYFLAKILDPNYQLYWVDVDVDLTDNDEEEQEAAKQRLLSKLKSVLH